MKYTHVFNADYIEIKDSSGNTKVKMGVLGERLYRLYVPGVSKHWESVDDKLWFNVGVLRESYHRLLPDIWIYRNNPTKSTNWMVAAHGENTYRYDKPPKDIELYNLLLGE